MKANRNQILYAGTSAKKAAGPLCSVSTLRLKSSCSLSVIVLSLAVPDFLLIACEEIYAQSTFSCSCILFPSLSVFLVAVVRFHCAGVVQMQDDSIPT